MVVIEDTPPRLEGTGITVVDVYAAYAEDGYEPAEIAHAFDISIADVHEALTYYYRHVEELENYDVVEDVQSVEEALQKQELTVRGYES